MDILAAVEQVFRDRQSFFADVKKTTGHLLKIRDTAIVWAVALLLSGAVIGVPGGVYQIIVTGIKLPLLLGISTLIALPVLYFLAQYLNMRLSLYQIGLLLSGMLVVVGVLTLAFTPILLVAWISIGDYALYKLLAAGVVAFSGVLGVLFLKDGLGRVVRGALGQAHQAFFWFWAVCYAFAGGQLVWLLRPFVGRPDAPFQLLRGADGSLYGEIARTLWGLIQSVL